MIVILNFKSYNYRYHRCKSINPATLNVSPEKCGRSRPTVTWTCACATQEYLLLPTYLLYILITCKKWVLWALHFLDTCNPGGQGLPRWAAMKQRPNAGSDQYDDDDNENSCGGMIK